MISKTLLTAALAAAIGYTCTALANANIINIIPSKDNTLDEYDPAEGDHSNGAGFHFFTGENARVNMPRRARLRCCGNNSAGLYDHSRNLEHEHVYDTHRCETVELHKLLADWGEGTSHAPMGEGDGAPATPNDATWRHRFFDTIFWMTEGGDFSAVASAASPSKVLDSTCGAQPRWWRTCKRG